MSKNCVVLLSGGLDSLLAVKLMAMQGIGVTALHTVNCFHGVQRIEEKKAKLRAAALALGAGDIVFPDITDDVVQLTKRPRHGYGKHLCKITVAYPLHFAHTGIRNLFLQL